MSKKDDPPELPQALVDHLRGLVTGRFFGNVTISMQAGRVVQIREEKVTKIEELARKEGA